MNKQKEIDYDFPDDYAQDAIWDQPDDFDVLVKKSKEQSEKPFALNIMEKLNEKVVGQEEAKKALTIAVRDIMLRRMGLSVPKTNILLMGPSGCGKTYLIQNICELASVPYAIINMPSVTGAGYRGEDIESGLERLIEDADDDLSDAENGIVFLDEFDKLLIKDGDNASSATVQAQLLKMIEGEKIDLNVHGRERDKTKPTIDTSNITFIFAGAFTDFEVKEDNVVGFGRSEKEEVPKDQYEELVKMGFSRELCGRIDRVVKMNGLTENELVEVSDKLIDEYKNIFRYDGVILKVDEQAKKKAAEDAIKKNLGTRGMEQIFKKIFDEARFEIAIDPSISLCRVTKDSISSGKAVLDKEDNSIDR